MVSMKDMPVWATGEELANSVTHGLAAVGAIFGAIYLIRRALGMRDKPRLIGYIIFGFSMIELYTASAVYHGLPDGKYKKFMRFVDHCSVFILIAGSYTPFTLTILKGHGGWIYLVLVWLMAIVGSIGKIFFFDKVFKYTIHQYIAMGWLIVFSAKTLIKLMPRRGLFYLVFGGVLYTIGALIFLLEVPYAHAIFHLFIIAGTLSQFVTIAFYI